MVRLFLLRVFLYRGSTVPCCRYRSIRKWIIFLSLRMQPSPKSRCLSSAWRGRSAEKMGSLCEATNRSYQSCPLRDSQLWLYFGLLSAFLGKDISSEMIVEDDPDQPGRQILNSQTVSRLIWGNKFGWRPVSNPVRNGEEMKATGPEVGYGASSFFARDCVLFACRAMNDIVID